MKAQTELILKHTFEAIAQELSYDWCWESSGRHGHYGADEAFDLIEKATPEELSELINPEWIDDPDLIQEKIDEGLSYIQALCLLCSDLVANAYIRIHHGGFNLDSISSVIFLPGFRK